MKSLLLATVFSTLALSSKASADPRPAGGHSIPNQAVSLGSCKRVLFYYNKFDRAYRTVCNNGGFFLSGSKR